MPTRPMTIGRVRRCPSRRCATSSAVRVGISNHWSPPRGAVKSTATKSRWRSGTCARSAPDSVWLGGRIAGVLQEQKKSGVTADFILERTQYLDPVFICATYKIQRCADQSASEGNLGEKKRACPIEVRKRFVVFDGFHQAIDKADPFFFVGLA